MKQRKILSKLIEEKNKRKISIILGARQVGKTTVLKEVQRVLNSGLFLDLDILSNFEKVSTYENLINTLKLSGYKKTQKEYFYLFLDEFQKFPDFSNVLKNVYDNNPNIKIYATGSSSVKIKNEVQESLAGRKIIHYLYPLDFAEFIEFKEDDEAIEQLKNINSLSGNKIHIPKMKELLNEFLIFGGYPEVVITQNLEDKKEVFKSIFDLYVKKDLIEYLKIDKILSVKRLIEILAINNGQKTNYKEIASLCFLKEYEIRKYIELLKETYLISEVRPFFTNKNKELVKIPKIYFIDNGVRNYFINYFENPSKRDDTGFLFEGYVYSELLKRGCNDIKFWQDKNLREVDFIIDKIHKQVAVEVKYKTRIKQEDYKGLRAFLNIYPLTEEMFLINPVSQYTNNQHITLKLPYSLDLC